MVQVAELGAEALAGPPDAVLLALRPAAEPVLGAAAVTALGELAPGTVLVQYWGDADRAAAAAAGVPVWPPEAPPPGHMGVLPSAVGPEPIVRLQAGGLKVGEVLARGLDRASRRGPRVRPDPLSAPARLLLMRGPQPGHGKRSASFNVQ